MKTNLTCVRPECPRTFKDELNFCQLCGATLTAVANPPAELDPYKTVVGTTIPDEPSKPEFDPYKTVVSSMQEVSPVAENSSLYGDNQDSMKTMIADPPSLELPSTNLPPIQPARFDNPPATPNYETPASPFSEPVSSWDSPQSSSPFEQPTPIEPSWNTPNSAPIETPSFDSAPMPSENQPPPPTQFGSPFEQPPPSPFGSPFEPQPQPQTQQSKDVQPSQQSWQEPETPAFGQNIPNSFGQDAGQWTAPPAPVANWENQSVGQNTPFTPPPVGMSGQNQTLPIVSLVFGILSICCYLAPITGLVALITGYLGMSNANKNPQQYGGKGLAIAGMIVGGIFFLIGVAYYILIIIGIAAGGLR